MKKEEGEKDIVGDSKNDVRDNVILEPLHSQELLSSAVPEQASSVPRGAASVQASYEPRGACRGPHTDFGRLTKNVMKKKLCCHAIDIDERIDTSATSTENDIEKILSKEDAPRRKTYFWFCQSNSNKEIKNEASDKSSLNWGLYRSVKELKLVGIHFKPSETCRFSDIKFNSGHLCGWLKLPRIIIKDGTKSLLLNLVAFEACADTSRNFGVSSYVYFMDTLIDHAEDAKELRSKGIIHNLLGSDEEVAKLFNEISENVVPDFGVVRNVEESLNAFFKSRRRLWLTECWHNHLRSPWAIIALLAAIVVVCLTITQTIFSAIQL
ncbi:uncharacterized protein LOC127790876 isoform X3 [Diospyros lotus]|uniref:uncharacterized protein LOC127790876 isoform X3 n=1 Tax=Diospyros lotus TaxID=55363 RepID=UPI00225BCDC6|nr:uncharacterized protein LOC127790876 isoform X3 [Diospyros lotus]